MTPTEEIIVNATCVLIGVLAGNRLTLGRDRILKREADIKADQLELIPLISGFINKAAHYPAPNIVRNESMSALKNWHFRFRIHLKGGRLTAFNAAWQALEQTTEAEMIGDSGQAVFTENQADEFKKVAQVLISRLQALLNCVEKA
jgi:hypothetical protein